MSTIAITTAGVACETLPQVDLGPFMDQTNANPLTTVTAMTTNEVAKGPIAVRRGVMGAI